MITTEIRNVPPEESKTPFLRIYNILEQENRLITRISTKDSGFIEMVRYTSSDGVPFEALIMFGNYHGNDIDQSIASVFLNKEGVNRIDYKDKDRPLIFDNMPFADKETIKNLKDKVTNNLADFLEKKASEKPRK